VVPAAKLRLPALHAVARERLLALVPRLWDHRLTLLVAPAGSGKTTLLAQLAAAAGVPTAWYSVDSSDVEQSVFLRGLEAAATASWPGTVGGWVSVKDGARAVEAITSERVLLAVDDFHLLGGTEAEPMLERLLAHAPPRLAVVIASRTRPGLNLPRLAVAGQMLELGPDDLRFRAWEVERLFRDHYGEPLPPEDLAELARRTEGWAAGLQLFHLATAGKPLRDRRTALAKLRTRWDAASEYLARNALEDLPDELREFLVDTCVLGRLSGAICDEFLDRAGSAAILAELERRQIFTSSVGGSGEYRYHEILRTQLEALLADRMGEPEARTLHRRAGRLLERAGAMPEALRAYAHGEDSKAVRRLLGRRTDEALDGDGFWLDALPEALVRDDPWLLLAAARRDRAAGRFRSAMETFRRAEERFGSARPAESCRRERIQLASWLDPASAQHPHDWLEVLRRAVSREPDAATQATPEIVGVEARLVRGIAALLSGRPLDAQQFLAGVREDAQATPGLVAAARVGSAAASLLIGSPQGRVEAELAVEDSERAGLLWLARISRTALGLVAEPECQAAAEVALVESECSGDPWGEALGALLCGLGALNAPGRAQLHLERAAAGFHSLGAAVLEAWAQAALSLALASLKAPAAKRAAQKAAAYARTVGATGALAFAYAALAKSDAGALGTHTRLLREALDETGLVLAAIEGPCDPILPGKPGRSVAVTCFGHFSLTVDGRELDLTAVKPRARQALKLLALNAGASVHREVLMEALWPNGDPRSAGRNLQVAVSAVRGVLGTDSGGPTIVRDGDCYRLALPPDSAVDLLGFDRALEAARTARRERDLDRCGEALRRAVDMHVSDLLAEEGPAEWIVYERERRRSEASQAAQDLGEVLLEQGRPVAAARACERGLRIDRHNDELWRLCIHAFERAGQAAAAAEAGRRYKRTLAELELRG
jgi:DNA-binding SARP family transcriptional activator